MGSSFVEEKMRLLSDELQLPQYQPSLIEVLLCESFAGQYLGKVDILFYQQFIFWMKADGIPLFKRFGKHETWEIILAPLIRRNIIFSSR